MAVMRPSPMLEGVYMTAAPLLSLLLTTIRRVRDLGEYPVVPMYIPNQRSLYPDETEANPLRRFVS